jgi:hypothetical protein
MHTNRPLFNLPGEGVSLYQSPVIFTGPQPGPDTHSRSSPSAGRDAAKWVFTCSPGIHCRAPPRRRGTKGSNPLSSSGESIPNLTAAYMVSGLFAFMMLSGRVAEPPVR